MLSFEQSFVTVNKIKMKVHQSVLACENMPSTLTQTNNRWEDLKTCGQNLIHTYTGRSDVAQNLVRLKKYLTNLENKVFMTIYLSTDIHV